MRVLVIDDDPGFTLLMQHTVGAETEAEPSVAYDVVICDLYLEGGRDEGIREMLRWKSRGATVIAVTASVVKDDVRQSQHYAEIVMSKPLTTRDIETLREICKRNDE